MRSPNFATSSVRMFTYNADMTSNTQAAIFGRIAGLNAERLSPEVARMIVGLAFDETDVRRMNELAEKNRDATLTDDERDELAEYRRAGDVLALMQSRARRVLKDQQGSRP